MFRREDAPEIVYFPACVTRIMGSSNLKKPSVVETVLALADRAGIKVRLPKSVTGVCCGQIWEHRGYASGRRYMANHLVESMWEWSDGGRVRVMCDVTSCTKTILRDVADQLTEANAERYRSITVVDVAPWLFEDVLPRLKVTRPKQSVALHPTCACVELEIDKQVQAIGEACAAASGDPRPLGLLRYGWRPRIHVPRTERRCPTRRARRAGRAILRWLLLGRPHLRDRPQPALRARVRVDRLPRGGSDPG